MVRLPVAHTLAVGPGDLGPRDAGAFTCRSWGVWLGTAGLAPAVPATGCAACLYSSTNGLGPARGCARSGG